MEKLNSRQIAEMIWKGAILPTFTYAHEIDAMPEPEDEEACLQAIEGILERHGGVEPDADLKKRRDENPDV